MIDRNKLAEYIGNQVLNALESQKEFENAWKMKERELGRTLSDVETDILYNEHAWDDSFSWMCLDVHDASRVLEQLIGAANAEL